MKHIIAVAALPFTLTLVSWAAAAQDRIDDEWSVSVHAAPFTKGRAVLLSKPKIGTQSYLDEARLVIQCFKNETSIFIDWPTRVTNVQRPMVTYRVGDEPFEDAPWTSSPVGWTTFYEGNSIELVEKFLTVDSFAVKVMPKYYRQTTAAWDLSGLSEKITPLREACGW